MTILIANPLAGSHARLDAPTFPVARMSDASHAPADLRNNWPWAGFPGRGWTNGYATYSNVSSDGAYYLAYGCQPFAALYQADGTFVSIMRRPSGKALGEAHDLRWSRNEGEPHTLYYNYELNGKGVVMAVEVVSGNHSVVSEFPAPLAAENHWGDVPQWRVVSCNKMLWTVDLTIDRAVSTGVTRTGIFDASHDGCWLQHDVNYYRINEDGTLALGGPIPEAKQAHACWAQDALGCAVYVYQDRLDFISVFDPVTSEYRQLLHIKQDDQWLNLHIARAVPGWCLVSTYVPDDNGWANNQLFLLSLAGDKLIRLGHTNNLWKPEKGEWYFAEAFASMSPDGGSVWWAHNQNGTSNLELYKMALPERWWAPEPARPTRKMRLLGVQDGVWEFEEL